MCPDMIETEDAGPLAESRRGLRRLASASNRDGALYFALLLLVWGLTASWRGMWQDDTLLLMLARTFQGHGFLAALTPVVSPLRRLYTLPSLLALATPQPIWSLHLLYGLTWLGQALAAGWIAQLLLPKRPLIRFLAICLTLTATSDYLTGNLTSLGYNSWSGGAGSGPGGEFSWRSRRSPSPSLPRPRSSGISCTTPPDTPRSP